MVQDRSILSVSFKTLNYVFLLVLSILCVLPLVHIFAISLSAGAAADAGAVKFWPVHFNLQSYDYVVHNREFIRSFFVSLERILIGVPLAMLLNVLCAYPLSKSNQDFWGRTVYVWIFIFSMLFHGGLIPTYMIVRDMKLLDTIWALVIPESIMVFNIVLMLNFFRNLPKELEEAAFMDGAGHWSILSKIYLPLSMPSVATILLFTIVSQWNEWFHGLIFMNSPEHYPMATYLQTVIIQSQQQLQSTDLSVLAQAEITNSTVQAALIFVGAIPVLCVYPFLQKHFAQGITLGSVKE